MIWIFPRSSLHSITHTRPSTPPQPVVNPSWLHLLESRLNFWLAHQPPTGQQCTIHYLSPCWHRHEGTTSLEEHMNQAHICTPQSHPGMSISHVMSSSIVPSWRSQVADEAGEPRDMELNEEMIGKSHGYYFLLLLVHFPFSSSFVTCPCHWYVRLTPLSSTCMCNTTHS